MVTFGKSKWEPSEKDILWAKNLVNSLKEGGVWALPGSGCIFKFSHKNKTIELVLGDTDTEIVERTEEVFKRIGYTLMK